MKHMQHLSSIFSKNVRLRRITLNLTQEELSEITGISVITISNIERDIQWPNPETIEKLAEGLDVHIYQLFVNEEVEHVIPTDSIDSAKATVISAVERSFTHAAQTRNTDSLLRKRGRKKRAGSKKITYNVTHSRKESKK